MDYDKLIERWRNLANRWENGEQLLLNGVMRIEDELRTAATALSTLQAENEKLRAELEKVKRERDVAQSLLAERIGVRGAEPITTAFGLPLDRLRELAQADRDGRCVVLPVKPGTPVWSTAFCKVDDDGTEHPTYPWPFDIGMVKDWGTDWFLTREEAEEELRREQE